jgi:hypothetical protein
MSTIWRFVARQPWLAGAIVLGTLASPAAAQDEGLSRVGADIEVHAGGAAGPAPGDFAFFTADSVSHVRLPGGLGLITRPYASKTSYYPWRWRLIQLSVRKEHSGRIRSRIEGGFLGPPVGLGSLSVRASTNPTIVPALAYGDYFPSPERRAPPLQLYARPYPLGAQVSLSGTRWDARAALVSNSPLRQQIPLARDRPAHAPQLIVGGGFTPRQGIRAGGWLGHGAWAKASELTTPPIRDRQATSGGIEAEAAFAWTRLAAEYTQARVDTATGPVILRLAVVEAAQTLTPRWYVAGRLRRASGVALDIEQQRTSAEATLGYRLNPLVTLRGGYYGLERFGADAWAHRAAVSVLWVQRLR